MLKAITKKVGDNVYIGKYVILKNTYNLEIGSNVSIHDFCYLDAIGGISISDNVSIAHNCTILSANHTWSDISIPIKYNIENLKKTSIGDNVWIGCGVKILAGVNINTRVVVAAGSVINKDIDSNILVGGMPAKKIKDI
jgi:acetyltransferase-like isoleucine patch superfamily enzyme